MASLKAFQMENISTPERLQGSQSSLISKVKVIVRVRPFLPQEISVRNGNSVSCVSTLQSDFETSDEVTVYLKDYETRYFVLIKCLLKCPRVLVYLFIF